MPLLEDMSKEELITLLKLQKAELEITKKALERERIRNNFIAKTIKECVQTIESLNIATSLKYGDLDELLERDFQACATKYFNDSIEWARKASSIIVKKKRTGTEQIASSESPKELYERAQNIKKSVKDNAAELGIIVNGIADAAVEVCGQGSSMDPLDEALLETAQQHHANQEERKEQARTRVSQCGGSLTARQKLQEISITPPKANTCSSCGNPDLEYLDNILHKVQNQAEFQVDTCKRLRMELPISRCKKCGHMNVNFTGIVPSITPRSEVGVDIITRIISEYAASTPMNRILEKYSVETGFSKSTLSDAVHRCCTLYLNPLFEDLLKDRQATSLTAIVDETNFTCLQDQGRGRHAKNAQADSDPKTSNCILAFTTPADSDKPFTCYYYEKAKNTETITSRLDEWQALTTLITDGATFYTKWADNQNPPIVHQSCLYHARRYLISCIDPKTWVAAIKQLNTDKARKNYFRQAVKERNSNALIALAIANISQIAFIESGLRRGINESIDSFYKRVAEVRAKQSTPIMDRLFTIIDELAKGRVELVRGRWSMSSKYDCIGKACAYFLNRKDELRAFLTTPNAVPHTNDVERAFRAIAMLRNVTFHKISPEYMKDLCSIFSLVDTAKQNGIVNVQKWLQDYCVSRFKFGLETALDLQAAKQRSKGLEWDQCRADWYKHIDVGTASAEFNTTPWLPENYSARQSS